ncbi:hypothetical protein [Corynebacterium coyleae]|uniref:hypothetical protein n=1 Tax=Corynebacterium coyleae TaxID=53374 RepID=UPI00254F1ED2|nr:hypothetical protein [Corynebacterium coyleae]MDK8798895.1 hypothetical protein [Corynebacterium coyleae]
MKAHHHTAVAAVLGSAALVLSGCASEDNIYTQARPEKADIAIAIDGASNEQIVLGEIYSRVLKGQGRPTSVTAVTGLDAAPTLEVLREQPIDFVVTCSGRLLEQADPKAAKDLEGGDIADGAYTDQVYDAAIAAMPGDMRSVDPSPAQACGESTLPQNVIPVFRKGTFDRGEINRLNFITRVLATDRLEEMTEQVDKGATVEDAIAEWMIEYAHIDVHHDTPADPEDVIDPDSASK